MMADEKSITVIVPARDEERNLDGAVATMVDAARKWFDRHEVLVFDDGSVDRTGEIADQLAARYPSVLAIHNPRSLSLGGVIREGVKRARMTHVIWVDGKGATSRQALDRIFSHAGQADLVIPYPTNQSQRHLFRRWISWAFRSGLNVLFGLNLSYYTHSVLCRTAQARKFTIRTSSYAYQAEALIKMIASGCRYVEVGVEDRYDNEGRRSKAFEPRNVIGVLKFVLWTFWDVYVTGSHRLDCRK